MFSKKLQRQEQKEVKYKLSEDKCRVRGYSLQVSSSNTFHITVFGLTVLIREALKKTVIQQI